MYDHIRLGEEHAPIRLFPALVNITASLTLYYGRIKRTSEMPKLSSIRLPEIGINLDLANSIKSGLDFRKREKTWDPYLKISRCRWGHFPFIIPINFNNFENKQLSSLPSISSSSLFAADAESFSPGRIITNSLSTTSRSRKIFSRQTLPKKLVAPVNKIFFPR